MENKRLWYIVQTYSGFENSVKENLLRRIETMQMENLIFQVMIPEEMKTEKKADGSTKEKMVKMFPGYVFIEMIVTDDSWFVVRNTPGVTGFLGSSGGGTKPIPLLSEEINPILKKCGLLQVQKLNAKVGQTVKVASGALIGRVGTIESINDEKGTVKILVDMFGRKTPIELDFAEIEVQ
ncbi:MAG TPA: transcription termination/antitermination protein NusG [Candidatus Izemoplasmatales bacterium]|nr:transcription termination/antitermination protein NusG [Bacillota bacterium]HRY77516.1 transcription termination/antitermination protein NusG [Candidatus Izemoplasmatales bacterium]